MAFRHAYVADKLLLPQNEIPLRPPAIGLSLAAAQTAPAERCWRGEPEQPSIKVTIGRVDVRAVMTPPAPVKVLRPSPAPALTLDEYLKQRTQGKR